MEEEVEAEEAKASSALADKDEEYETVNEGLTTDTTEAPSHAARRGEPEAAEVSNTQAAASEEKEEV
jgi:hypothetical protein